MPLEPLAVQASMLNTAEAVVATVTLAAVVATAAVPYSVLAEAVVAQMTKVAPMEVVEASGEVILLGTAVQ